MEIFLENEDVYLTEYGIPIRNIWHMLLYTWDNPPIERIGKLGNIEDSPTLDALLAAILIKLIQQRIRIGLSRNYLEENHLLNGIRGKIDFSNSIKQSTFQKNQAFCDFEVFSQNVIKNQVIKSTLFKLVQSVKFGPDKSKANKLKHLLRVTSRLMDGIDIIELKPDIFKRQQIGRNDRDYKIMLSICELLYLHQLPMDTNGSQQQPEIIRETLVMHKIYEDFVANFYRLNLIDWIVEPQKKMEWFDENENTYLPIMKPDIMFTNKTNGKVVILDTKFTANSLVSNQWGRKIFNQSHLYQIYTYLKTQEHISKNYRYASGILLYPTINNQPLSEIIILPGHEIKIETINLAKDWQQIELDLLNLIH